MMPTTDATLQAHDDRIKELGRAILGGGINAAAAGVTTTSSDNTAVLAALAGKYQRTDSTTVVIDLPPGVIKGHLPSAPGVVWRFNGTTIQFPNAGPTKHQGYPLTPSWWGATDGTGANRGGIIGVGVIDGEMDKWGLAPAPTGPTPALATTTGSLTGNGAWYSYRVAYKTSFGLAKPGPQSDVQLSSATGGVTLTWTNPSGAAGLQVVIYGRRTPWDNNDVPLQELVTLAAGTTTWTDNGSAALSGPAVMDVDLSCPSFIWPGAGYVIDGHIVSLNMPGTGFVSRFEADVPKLGTAVPARGDIRMEANIRGLHVVWPGSDGMVFQGPHDMWVRDFTVVRPGESTTEDRTGVYCGSWGPYVFESGHIWGLMAYNFQSFGHVTLRGVQMEGASKINCNLQDKAQLTGCEIFYPTASGAKGLVVGKPSWKPAVNIDNLYVHEFNSSHGVAMDLTNLGSGSRITAQVRQDTGTVVAAPTSWGNSHVQVAVSGGLGSQSITVPASGGGGGAAGMITQQTQPTVTQPTPWLQVDGSNKPVNMYLVTP